MTKIEETILDQKISGLNLRIILVGVAFIVSGVVTASAVYHGIVAEIQAGNAKHELLQQQVNTVEKRVDGHDQSIKAIAEKRN